MTKGNSLIFLALAADALLIRLVLLLSANKYFADDAYIFMRCAENFANGHGLVYNIGEQVLVLTSWSYGLGMAVLKMSLPFVSTATLIITASIILFLVYTFLIYRFLDPASPLYWSTVVFLLFSYPAIEGSVNGMETTLFLVTIVATLVALSKKSYVLALVCSTLAVLVRPEGIFLALFVMLGAAAHLRWGMRLLKGILLSALLLAIVLVPIYLQFGTIIPHSMIAKSSQVTGHGMGYSPGVFLRGLLLGFGFSDNSFYSLSPALAWFLVIAFVVFLALFGYGMVRAWKEKPAIFYAGALYLAIVAFYEIGNPVKMFSWYTYPTAICFVVVALYGVERIGWVARIPAIRRSVAVIVVVVCIAEALLVTNKRGQSVQDNVGDLHNVALKIQREYPRAKAIMLSDIGIVGYVTNARIVDLAGLASPLVLGRGPDGMRPSLGYLVKKSDPDVVCLTSDPLVGKETVEGHQQYLTFVSDAEKAQFLKDYERVESVSRIYPNLFVHQRVRESRME